MLDVARIAYVKYGFTEAPGLVKFEQEIDRELSVKNGTTFNNLIHNVHQSHKLQSSDNKRLNDNNKKFSSRARNSCDPIGRDPTDELILRYCKHKEEEATRAKSEELAKSRAAAAAEALANEIDRIGIISPSREHVEKNNPIQPNESGHIMSSGQIIETDSLIPTNVIRDCEELLVTKSPIGDLTSQTSPHKNLSETGRVDSLDSGEGPTESASTDHSGQNIYLKTTKQTTSIIPVPAKRTNFSPSLQRRKTPSMTNSELSSSRSSLFSCQEGNISSSTNGRQTSDLDGKVMRIAKTYYGKGATKGVTRLSEGKYKIADRIVFVRLLKGHRVMVRIGGGWDTLENFLIRHKSDPSQVIDVNNLLLRGQLSQCRHFSCSISSNQRRS